MSRLLAELGIGVASLALVVDAHSVRPGDTIDTRVEIEGGARDQRIEALEYGMATSIEGDSSRRLVEFGRDAMTEPFTVTAGATETIDTAISIPRGTPTTTIGDTAVWLTAGLEVDWAPDPAERAALDVLLPQFLQTVVDTLEGESMVCLDASCRSASVLPVAHRYDFLQVFDFQPRGGHYDRDIGTLEVVPTYPPESDRTRIILVRDVKSGRLALENLDAKGVAQARFEVTQETNAATIRTELLDALEDLVP